MYRGSWQAIGRLDWESCPAAGSLSKNAKTCGSFQVVKEEKQEGVCGSSADGPLPMYVARECSVSKTPGGKTMKESGCFTSASIGYRRLYKGRPLEKP